MKPQIPFDAVVTLSVFLVGVPAVVLQTLPPEVRQVLAKRSGQLLVDAAVPFLLAAVVFVVGLTASRIGLVDGDAAWTAVLSTTLLIGVLSAVHVVRKYGRRDSVVRRLEREAARALDQGGRLVEESLRDLVDLGRQSDPGPEREFVLASLLALTDRTCARPEYRGDGLEDLIAGAIEILGTEVDAPHHGNFSTAVELLRRTLRSMDGRDAGEFMHADALHAIYGMSRLGRASLRLASDDVPLRTIQALGVTGKRHPATTTPASQALFELGVAAIERDRLLVAMSSLGQLVALVEENAPAEGELVADVLGLLGHFWAHGEAGRELARRRLEELRPCLKSDPFPALDAAVEHAAERALFRTSDHLRRMRRELAPGPGTGTGETDRHTGSDGTPNARW